MRASRIVLGVAAVLAAVAAVVIYWWHGIVYERTSVGTLKGKLQVEWVDQDTFLFTPDPANPLAFTRANKEVIQPGTMHTDGGTIPVALRAIKSYSPWGYAPAFIIHDWLFVMKHCKLPGHEKLDLDGAASVMAETLKTMMESKRYGEPNKLVLFSMYQAVRTPVAREYWDTGKCSELQNRAVKADEQYKRERALRGPTVSAPPASSARESATRGPLARYTIEFK